MSEIFDFYNREVSKETLDEREGVSLKKSFKKFNPPIEKIEGILINLTKDLLGMVNQWEDYLGLEIKKNEISDITDLQVYKDLYNIYSLYFYKNEISENEKHMIKERVFKNKLIMLFDNLKHKEEHLYNLNFVYISQAIENMLDINTVESQYVYISQAEASRILEKNPSYVNRLIEEFDPKIINGVKKVRSDLVLARRETTSLKKDYKNDNRYMDIVEVADFLNITTNTVYSYLKKDGELYEYLEKDDVLFLEKEFVYEYRKNVLQNQFKFNAFDYITSKELTNIFKVTPTSIHAWMRKELLVGTETYKGKKFVPIQTVLDRLNYLGFDGIGVIEERNNEMVNFIYEFAKSYGIILNKEKIKKEKVINFSVEEVGRRVDIEQKNKLIDLAREKQFISYVTEILEPQILEINRRFYVEEKFEKYIKENNIKLHFEKKKLDIKLNKVTYHLIQEQPLNKIYENEDVIILTDEGFSFLNRKNISDLEGYIKDGGDIFVELDTHDKEYFYNKELLIPHYHENIKNIIDKLKHLEEEYSK